MTSYWAKTIAKTTPGIDVYQHGEYVRSVLHCLYDVFSTTAFPPDFTKHFLGFLAAVHDVGKISRQFQAKCLAWLVMNHFEDAARFGDWKNGPPHNKISQDALERFFAAHFQGQEEARACWGSIIGAHHGRIARSFDSSPSPLENPNKNPIDWEQERQALLSHFWQKSGCTALPSLRQDSPEMWTAAGLLTLADWIGSDEHFFSADPAYSPASLEQTAAEAVARIGLGSLHVRPGLSFKDIFTFEPNDMQRAACEIITGSGVYVIEAPMGMGKTEAALMAAYKLMVAGKARGLYFGLPTQATSNRIFLRVQEFAKHISEVYQSVQLIHANAWLEKVPPPELSPALPGQPEKGVSQDDAHNWFSSSRRALLAPIGVGTADQAMLAALAVKHFPLRRLALAGKVVILDEVHSYDCYTGTIIQKLCELLQELNCTVIILSATLTKKYCATLLKAETQPEAEIALLPPYPLIHSRQRGQKTIACPIPPPNEKNVTIVFTPQAEMLAQSLHLAAQGAQELWICNSVGRAQETYATLRERCSASDIRLGLLHARLPFCMRHEREHYWMEAFGKNGARQQGAILVATQIAEQSVDLDADVLVTELAPTDMLLQRMGRLWRHQPPSRPVPHPCVHILQEEVSLAELRAMRAGDIKKALGTKAFVYDPFVLAQTLSIWSAISQVSLPSQIRELIEATYSEPEDLPPAWEELRAQLEGSDMARKLKARMNTNVWQQAWEDAEENAPTRLIEHTEFPFVLYQKKEGAKMILLDDSAIDTSTSDFCSETARNLHRNMVKIPDYRLAGSKQSPFLKGYNLWGWARIEDNSVYLPGAKDNTIGWDTTLGIVWPKTKEQA